VLLVALLTTLDALVDRPLRAPEAAAAQGGTFAIIALAVCVVTGAVYVGARSLARVRRWRNPVPPLRPAAKVAVGAVAAIGLVGAVVAADPGRLIQDFQQTGNGEGGLGSTAGSGRYQFWSAALDQFQANPVVGDGAGAYQAWWAANPRFPYFVKDAHSLYLETLGELGIVGFALLIGALAFSLVTGVRRLRGREGPERLLIASLCAAVLAWGLAAAIDWMWEMPLVTGVAIVCLGLLVGPATAPRAAAERSPESPPARARRGSRSFGLGVAVIAVAWLIICAQASPLLSELRLEDSRAAYDRGDYGAAVRAARGARILQPWSAAPYQQLALVEEERGRLAAAHRYIEAAIERQPNDFVLWEDAARIETAAGKGQEARESTARSRELNPRLTGTATVAP